MSIVKHIVVVGDGAVGKTSLLYAYTNGMLLDEYVPTIYDKEVIELKLDNVTHMIKLHDTAGHEEYSKLRQIFYKEADCFVLCYSIPERTSFENVEIKWVPELRSVRKDVPIVLLGTKHDLRDTTIDPVATAEGEKLQKKINANTFIECSAKTQMNVKEAIYEAVRATVQKIPEPEVEPNWYIPLVSCCFR